MQRGACLLLLALCQDVVRALDHSSLELQGVRLRRIPESHGLAELPGTGFLQREVTEDMNSLFWLALTIVTTSCCFCITCVLCLCAGCKMFLLHKIVAQSIRAEYDQNATMQDRTKYQKEAAEWFKSVDRDGDGFVSEEELKKSGLLKALSNPLGSGPFIVAFDTDGDGKLSETEFVDLYHWYRFQMTKMGQLETGKPPPAPFRPGDGEQMLVKAMAAQEVMSLEGLVGGDKKRRKRDIQVRWHPDHAPECQKNFYDAVFKEIQNRSEWED